MSMINYTTTNIFTFSILFFYEPFYNAIDYIYSIEYLSYIFSLCLLFINILYKILLLVVLLLFIFILIYIVKSNLPEILFMDGEAGPSKKRDRNTYSEQSSSNNQGDDDGDDDKNKSKKKAIAKSIIKNTENRNEGVNTNKNENSNEDRSRKTTMNDIIEDAKNVNSEQEIYAPLTPERKSELLEAIKKNATDKNARNIYKNEEEFSLTLPKNTIYNTDFNVKNPNFVKNEPDMIKRIIESKNVLEGGSVYNKSTHLLQDSTRKITAGYITDKDLQNLTELQANVFKKRLHESLKNAYNSIDSNIVKCIINGDKNYPIMKLPDRQNLDDKVKDIIFVINQIRSITRK